MNHEWNVLSTVVAVVSAPGKTTAWMATPEREEKE